MRTYRRVGVPYTDEMIENARADFRAQANPDADHSGLLERYPGAQTRNFDGQPELTEMDAMIAYMQMLGTLVDFSTFVPDPQPLGGGDGNLHLAARLRRQLAPAVHDAPFFIGVVIWAFRPGSRKVHDETASDDLPQRRQARARRRMTRRRRKEAADGRQETRPPRTRSARPSGSIPTRRS
jgi:hypothetical protein